MFLIPGVLTNKTGGSGGFVPNGLDFYNGGSGSNYIYENILAGVPDGYTGSMSIWVNYPGAGSLVSIAGATVALNIFADGSINFTIESTDLSKIFIINASGSLVTTAGWNNFLISWDTNHSAGNKIGNLYMNGTSIKTSLTDISAAFTIGYNEGFTSFPNPGPNYNIYLSEIWYAPNQFIDFTVSGNRALFYNAGNAVYLGADGSTPTGTAPAVYIHNHAATAGMNLGTGGNFSTIGTITDTSPPP